MRCKSLGVNDGFVPQLTTTAGRIIATLPGADKKFDTYAADLHSMGKRAPSTVGDATIARSLSHSLH